MHAALRPPPDRRLAALALTALVHALLLLGWQAARRLPAIPGGAEPAHIQWIDLRPRVPALPRPRPAHAREDAHPPARAHADADAPAPAVPAPVASGTPAAADPGAASAPASAPAVAPGDGVRGGALLQSALRAAGSVDKALRKENKAYITAPLDSAQMRLQRSMEAAHDAVPPKLWEAPRVDELVNNTGDGARHTRIVTGNGTMCETDRAPTSSIDTIEILGKRRFTNCPQHETPATAQDWRTARD